MKKLIVFVILLFLLSVLSGCYIVSIIPAIPTQIGDPIISGEPVSRDEILDLLRAVFPLTMFRGVEAPSFESTSLSEIKRFLAADDTDQLNLGTNVGDYVFRLIGQFSQLGWEKIPVGWAKNDYEIYNIVVVREWNKLKVYRINPMTDQIWRVNIDLDVKFVLIG